MQLFQTIVVAVSYRLAKGQRLSCENRALMNGQPACCVGADNGCTGVANIDEQNDPSFAGANTPSSTPCFCDDRCFQLGDCCHDFMQTCKYPQDCDSMSAWSDWSKCKLPSKKSCGKGVMTRNRENTAKDIRCFTIDKYGEQQPQRKITQSRSCNERCPLHKSSAASIIPASASFRKELNNGDYCHLYKVTRRNSACMAQKSVFKNICVKCRSDVMLGDGKCRGSVEASRGSWTIENLKGIRPYCHGRWINFYKKVDCSVCMKKGAPFLYI